MQRAHTTSGCSPCKRLPGGSPALPSSGACRSGGCHRSKGVRELEERMEGPRVVVDRAETIRGVKQA